jgi:hypothetical protein
MAFLFMLFQDSAGGNFFGTVSIPTTLFGRLFNVLILALLFLTHTFQRFFSWHSMILLFLLIKSNWGSIHSFCPHS